MERDEIPQEAIPCTTWISPVHGDSTPIDPEATGRSTHFPWHGSAGSLTEYSEYTRHGGNNTQDPTYLLPGDPQLTVLRAKGLRRGEERARRGEEFHADFSDESIVTTDITLLPLLQPTEARVGARRWSKTPSQATPTYLLRSECTTSPPPRVKGPAAAVEEVPWLRAFALLGLRGRWTSNTAMTNGHGHRRDTSPADAGGEGFPSSPLPLFPSSPSTARLLQALCPDT
ncbi:unnamed protein product [Diplocarpon coronariae]